MWLDGCLSCCHPSEIVQPISFNLSPRPIAFELEADRFLAGCGAFDEADLSAARPDMEMINNVILDHLSRPAPLQEQSGYRQVPGRQFQLKM
jgi:hypothetical protein